jgi:hypothetical protein
MRGLHLTIGSTSTRFGINQKKLPTKYTNTHEKIPQIDKTKPFVFFVGTNAAGESPQVNTNAC